MKTTIELSDALLSEAKQYAARHQMTLKTLIEQGLRAAMADAPTTPPFRLRDASFNGGSAASGGFSSEFQNASWEQIRDAAYEDRGA